MKLIWDAKIEEGAYLHFDGWADFEGINIRVKNIEDADILTKEIFGDYIKDWKKEVGEIETLPDDYPADRRTWYPVTYKPNVPISS